jgi:RNA polymerase sigma-70 factor (ECF subfamily)
MDRLLAGDHAAFVELARLVTGFLISWRAYDLRDEWDDLIQDVLTQVASHYASGRVRQREALVGYIRTVARRRFVDILRRNRPNFVDLELDELPQSDPNGIAGSLRRHVERLPEKQRTALEAVYLEGRTQQEAAKSTGIPLGSLKRYLREGLSSLRTAITPGEIH